MMMTETAAILLHPTDCFPDAKFAPAPGTPAHRKLLRWMVFHNVNLYEAVARHGPQFRYTNGEDGYEDIQCFEHLYAGATRPVCCQPQSPVTAFQGGRASHLVVSEIFLCHKAAVRFHIVVDVFWGSCSV